MNTFIIRDFQVQSFLMLTFFVMLILDLAVLDTGYCILIYFFIAVNHLISANARFFSKDYHQKIGFRIYYWISMIFMICLIVSFLIINANTVNEFTNILSIVTFSFAIFGTPVLAVIYYLICYYEYQNVKAFKI